MSLSAVSELSPPDLPPAPAEYRLPTMQQNALRILLGKRDFRPNEVAMLDYHVLERAPRIGRKGIDCIRNWLRQYGLDVANPPPPRALVVEANRKKRVEKAVQVIRRNGFVVNLESAKKAK